MSGLDHDADRFAAIAEAERHAALEKKAAEDSDSLSILSQNEPDGIHDGLTFPTQEERNTLRHVSDKIPWNAYLIAFVELAERFSYYGSTVVFTNFIQQPLPAGSRTGSNPDGQPGALGMGQRASTGLTTFNTFWVYVIPLFGAYVADTYWGRFKTISVSVVIAMVGHVLLIISAVPGVIEKSNAALAVFVIAILTMGLGTGGFKSNISPLVAEQYKRTKLFIGNTKKGEKVIVDPGMTTTRIYMYFYLFINIGALVGQIGMVYAEKHVGFWLSYLLPTLVFATCPLVLWLGRNRYVTSPPSGSVLAAALRLWRYAARGRWSANPLQTWRNLKADDFWESAKPSRIPVEQRPKWMTFDDAWVDEVRRGLKACSVFTFIPIYWLTYNQCNNNLTSQAATMQTHGLPNDVLSNLNPFALIIGIPICDFFVYPALRRAGIRFTPVRKIALGFFVGAAAMAWAAVIQYYIYKRSPCGYDASSCFDDNKELRVAPINVWAQTGSYVLIAVSEIFTSITGLEYAFTKAPRNMRSLVMSVWLFMSAISAALGQAFVTLSEDPLLIWNYGTMGVLAFIAGSLFWLCFRHLDAEEERLNELAVGHVDNSKH